MGKIKSKEKVKLDLKAAEIVYYTIGGLALLIGVVFSILGLILINPTTANFENSALLAFQKTFFEWLKWETNFEKAGAIIMSCTILYFIIVFAIFAKKGDEVSRRVDMQKSRQRQVEFVAPVDTDLTKEYQVSE